MFVIFLGQMCTQHDEISKFMKEDTKKAFPALRSVYLDYEDHPNKCCSYHKCQHSLRVFSWLRTGLSDSQPLLRKALY